MCGIAGFVSLDRSRGRDDLANITERMTNTIRHRGPDGSGAWVDERSGVALGHRRLAIIDLSATGAQPMTSADGRYVVTYNGEIYNYQELRADLLARGRRFRGTSDTEVMLEAFSEWGVEPAVHRMVGMFAIALWDRREQRLYLIRDRMGEKPLYYGLVNGALVFGSELKALRAFPGFPGEIDRQALTLFLRYCHIPAPFTIYRSVFKLPPATILTVDMGSAELKLASAAYWSVRDAVREGLDRPFGGSPEEAVAELERLLIQSVKGQMIADVPLGAFLSGGIDSSAVVALMQQVASRPVRTFTVGFAEAGYNEAAHARAVAEHLGTDHTQLDVTATEALAVIPRLPGMYDEPFADNSQIPTHLVSALARRHVTVALSGDGGDELFGGYDRYLVGRRIQRVGRRLPGLLRRLAAAGSSLLLDRPFGGLIPMADQVGKGLAVLSDPAPERGLRQLVTYWRSPEQVAVNGSEPPTVYTDPARWIAHPDPVARMMYLDTVSYLPDDILVKLDRAAMAVSLEGRVPLLDHRVVEFAWTLPGELRLRAGQTKWALRQVLCRHVPRELVERPKQGFALPIAEWLRGPLREWAEAQLDESRLRREGYLDPRRVRTAWLDHLRGRRNRSYQIWAVLMFQAWLDEFAGQGRR